MAAATLVGCGGSDGSGDRQLPDPVVTGFDVDPPYPWPNTTVKFRGRCTGTAPFNYVWSFGDGASMNTASDATSHTYTTGDRTYTASLTCSDANGNSQAATSSIDVYRRNLASVDQADCKGAYIGHGWCLQQPTADGPMFRMIGIADADTLWGIGRTGTVLRARSDGTSASHLGGVRAFAAANADVAWALHAGGMALTRNGSQGASADWQTLPPVVSPDGSLRLTQANYLHAAGPGLVYALAPNALWRSATGGQTWAVTGWSAAGKVPLATFASGANRIWVIGKAGLFEASANGGAAWTKVGLPGAPTADMVAAGANAARTEGWVASADGAVYFGDLATNAWTRVREPITTEQQRILSISVNANVPWLAGYRLPNGSTSGARPLLLRGLRDVTTGAVTFTEITVSGVESALRSIAAYRSVAAWTSGDRNLFRAVDLLAEPVFKLTGPTVTLRAVDASDEMTAWAVADSGFVLRTRSGGVDWSVVRVPINGTTPNLRAVLGLGADEAWTLGGTPELFKTTNGGAAWSVETPASGVQSLQAMARDPAGAAVWLGGRAGTVLRSTDNGTTWQAPACARPADASFTAAAARSADVAWFVGQSASAPVAPPARSLYQIAQGGGACGWVALKDAADVRALTLNSANEVWVVGTDVKDNLRTGLWRSADGGTTWQHWVVPAIQDPQAIAAGSGGLLWVSTPSAFWKVAVNSSGANAQLQADLQSSQLPALSLNWLNNQTLWGVGSTGQIWKTLTGGDYIGSQGPKPGQVSPDP